MTGLQVKKRSGHNTTKRQNFWVPGLSNIFLDLPLSFSGSKEAYLGHCRIMTTTMTAKMTTIMMALVMDDDDDRDNDGVNESFSF